MRPDPTQVRRGSDRLEGDDDASGPSMSAFAEARARHALADAGLNSDVPLVPLRSVTNEVWVAGEHIVRLNRRQDHRLQREAMLAPYLPPELGYPPIVHYGGEI